jgi:N-acetylneuraminic acid mutarotase
MKKKMTIIPNVILLAFVVGAIQVSSGFGRQKKENTTGSWKKMSQAAPVMVRAKIGAVISGNRLVVWGGEIKDQPASDGAVYDIDKDVWKKMAAAPMEGREHFTMTGYGNRVIVWGGENNPNGAIYDIDKDFWQKIAEAPFSLGMEPYTWGIIGNKLLVWGIGKTKELNPVGGIYDIDKDTWKKMADLTAMKAVDDWPPFFYKNKFLVWGCPNAGKADRYGAIYDINKDEWKEMAAAPIERRNWPAAVLAGSKLAIWGGCAGPVEAHTATSHADGAVYDIDHDTWKKMAQAPLEARWALRSFAWGRRIIVWGGMGTSEFKNKFFYYDGAIYDLETDRWEKIPEAPLKSEHARDLYSFGIFGYNPTPPALLGNKLIVWSFFCQAIYDLDKKTWTEMAPAPIGGRDYHVSLLSGNKLIIWGGRDEKNVYADGAILDISK